MKLSLLEERVTALERRNTRVEADKAWESSWQRRSTVALLTYFTVVGYFHFVIHINPWLNAIVPTIGFILSTLTLSVLKRLWIEKRSKAD